MALADKIHQRVLVLPEPLQAEVLDFVEFLLSKFSPDLQEYKHKSDPLHSIKGKYSFVQTSSSEFAKRKQTEIELEG